MQVQRVVTSLVAIIALSWAAGAQERRSVGAGGAIPEGTQVEIRIIDSLSSETAREGDTFHGTLNQPIEVNGRTLYPKGADVSGTITRAHRSGRLTDPGELELVLNSISTGGRAYPINTGPWSLKGESHTKSNATKIGGGAVLGTVIGAIAGGAKGAAIGAGVGAGAGTAGAAATGKKDAKIESEALLTFLTLAPAEQYATTPAAQREPEYRSDSASRPTDSENRSYEPRRDRWRQREFKPEFTNYDRQNIRGCFYDTANLPPGIGRRDSLPPGLAKQIERNAPLPPALERGAEPLPDTCNARLPRLPADWSRVLLGNRVLLLDPSGRVSDQFNLDDEE
jgi:hypothetical protein